MPLGRLAGLDARRALHHVLLVLTLCVWATGCALPTIRPAAAPPPPPGSTPRAEEALLILPGFGYGGDGVRALQSLAATVAREGIDLYVPTYLARGGLDDSRTRLQQFVREHELSRYRRLHVFAFIAGAWTLNPLVNAGALPNLATVIYDRSPYQERAPAIALARLPLLTRLRYGSPVFDVARTPYAPLAAPAVKVALMVETEPTAFIRRHARAVRSRGPISFTCDGFGQRHDDCLYLAMDHDELYARFADVWPEVLAFIRTGRFTAAADRTAPVGDPLSTITQ